MASDCTGGKTRDDKKSVTAEKNVSKSKDSGRKCYKCGEGGHMASDCTGGKTRDDKNDEAVQQEGEDGPIMCRLCNEEGHLERFCAKNPDKEETGCWRCGGVDHYKEACTNTKTFSGLITQI